MGRPWDGTRGAVCTDPSASRAVPRLCPQSLAWDLRPVNARWVGGCPTVSVGVEEGGGGGFRFGAAAGSRSREV